jgi:hypothetical protein
MLSLKDDALPPPGVVKELVRPVKRDASLREGDASEVATDRIEPDTSLFSVLSVVTLEELGMLSSVDAEEELAMADSATVLPCCVRLVDPSPFPAAASDALEPAREATAEPAAETLNAGTPAPPPADEATASSILAHKVSNKRLV